MKNYDDFAEEVFREADRRLALKRKRAAVIRQYTLAFASMFAIILTGIFVIKNETVREALEKKFNAQNIIIDESSVTAPPADTTVPDHEPYEPEITTEAVASPPDDIRNTTAKPAASTTAAKTTTTSAHTSDISVTSTRTTSRHYVTSTKYEYTQTSTVTVSKTTHTTATATRSTKTTATTSRIYVTSTTGTRTPVTTQNPPTTTSGGTFTTTIHGTHLTSTTFPPSTSTSWATETTTTVATTSTETTSLVTYTVSSTTTSVPQTTTVTQPLYPDVELPPETADPSGNVTVPVAYFCAGEMSGSENLNKQIGVIMIESGGTEYECSVYSIAGFDTTDRVAIYIKDKWLIYWAVARKKG